MKNQVEHENNKAQLVNFPEYSNLFIGRDFHLQRVLELLSKEHNRLITLLGPGGIGKTRLSVEIGKKADHLFEDIICFVALDAITDFKEVPRHIAQALSIQKRSTYNWEEEVIAYLKEKNTLLVLDNLEQILDSALFINQLLNTCPQLKILTSSRAVLHLEREIEYPLDGLSRPSLLLHPSPEELTKFGAIDLFVQKAKSILPNFKLDAANANAIIDICQYLDGLPLPIELAAVRLKIFSPEALSRKLKENSNLLKSNSRSSIARHQTISNTIKWSYDLLASEEQEVFQSLSLFKGGFSLEAIEALHAQYDALELIESFLNKSLIVKGQDIQWTARFRMLKLIRDFALALLKNKPNHQAYLFAFSSYYLSFLKKAYKKLQIKDEPELIELIAVEYDNLITAYNFLKEENIAEAIDFMLHFWTFHLRQGRMKEGLVLLEPLLKLSLASEAKAKLLEAAGTLAHNLGAYSKARTYFQECLTLREGHNDHVQLVKALNNIGWMAWRTGDYKDCIQFANQAIKISNISNDELGQASAINNKAWALFYQGYFNKSLELQEMIFESYSRHKNQRLLAFAKCNLARAIFYSKTSSGIDPLLEEAIQSFDELRDQQLSAFSRLIKADILIEMEQYDLASDLLKSHCLPGFKKISDLWGIAHANKNLGIIAFNQQAIEKAKEYFNNCHALVKRTEDKFGLAIAQFYLAKIEQAYKNEEGAAQHIQKAMQLALEMESLSIKQILCFEIGTKYYQLKEYDRAHYFLAAARFYAQKSSMGALQSFAQKLEKLKPIFKNLPKKAPTFSALEKKMTPNHELLRPHFLYLLKQQESTQHKKLAPELPIQTEDPFLKKVLALIKENLSNPDFKVEDLSQGLHLSSSHLHRKLDALTGRSASKLISSIRLEKAQELLADPNYTITAVAYDTGFKDPDYFHRVFKKHFGITPGAYRKSLDI